MSYRVRRLGPGDEAVLELLAREAADFDLAGLSGADPPLGAAEAQRYLTDPAVLHWVAEEDGRVLGELLSHVLRLPFGVGRELLLYSIGVRERARRRGIGRALVGELTHWARAEGIEDVWVLADNPGAERFYAACGFARGGEQDQGVLLLLSTRGDRAAGT